MHARSEFVMQLRALPDTPVTWTGGRPEDEDARLVWEAVTRWRLTTYRSVVAFFRSFCLAHARQLLGRPDLRGPLAGALRRPVAQRPIPT